MLQVDFIDAVARCDAAEWDGVAGDDYPFTRHAFLAALEASGAVTAERGWQPHHLTLRRDGTLVALMPLYLKQHSYGEYVFDWSWADAYQRHGLRYYPKLLGAIPFTPATGPRLCIRAGESAQPLRKSLAEALVREAERLGISSAHVLFPRDGEADELPAAGFMPRHGAQYHWSNPGYRDFSDFLDGFSSRKRKNLLRERRRVAEQGVALRVLEGAEIDAARWQQFHHFYQMTYAKRSGHGGYLNLEFFLRIGATLQDHLVMVLAEQAGEVVAGALNFRDSQTLYGRYWGCTREIDQLHFEACYYQGIEYCIRNGLQRFDPGAQGEHKIQRGFAPVRTTSWHWIAHPEFRAAIDDFLQRERVAVAEYLEEAATLLPFRRSG